MQMTVTREIFGFVMKRRARKRNKKRKKKRAKGERYYV